MADDAVPESGATPRPAPEPWLDQAAVDALAGYAASPPARAPSADTVRALAEGRSGAPEPLPLLSIIGRALAGRLSPSFREAFGCDVAVVLEGVETSQLGSLLDTFVLPLAAVPFQAEGWAGGGLVALGPDFGRLALDALLGAPRSFVALPASPRPFTAIETAILFRLVADLLREAEDAFGAAGPVRFVPGEVVADPRLAGLGRDADPAWRLAFSVAAGAASASVSLVIPHASLVPVLPRLRQGFVERPASGSDGWAVHLAAELGRSEIAAEAVLHEARLPLGQILKLGIGDTLTFDRRPSDLVLVRCGGRTLTRGRIGRVDGRIAVEVAEPLRHAAEAELLAR